MPGQEAPCRPGHVGCSAPRRPIGVRARRVSPQDNLRVRAPRFWRRPRHRFQRFISVLNGRFAEVARPPRPVRVRARLSGPPAGPDAA
ncbi:hypothetical protein M446_3314 [Methylobacterium sp. 4-46]|nr:hypothetical protein M446_3314 [Methylobacterium sp. 4-46]